MIKTILELVKVFEKHKPADLLAATKLGLTLTHVGSGCFRQTYRVKGLSVVVKFPLNENIGDCGSDIDHANDEIKVINKIMRAEKYKILRMFMPKVYYHNSKTGVIIMHYYKKLRATDQGISNIIDNILLEVLQCHNFTDIKPSNLGYHFDKDNDVYNYKILDLGCLAREGW